MAIKRGTARPGLRRPLILAAILSVGLALALWQPIELARLLEWGRRTAGHPGAMPAVILLQVVLFAFALPGTMVLWLIAPFYRPLAAVAMLVTGSVIGALAAYGVARRLGGDWRPRRGARSLEGLAQRKGFLTQCALRILPGFPHWAINYPAGILGLPLLPFTLAAAIGLSIKWSAYVWMIHDVTSLAEADAAIQPRALVPMIGLAVLLVAGSLLRRRLFSSGEN